MNFIRVLLAGSLLLTVSPVRAVYAPVPEQDQGKSLVLTLKSGLSFDTNLFGASSNNIESAVFQFSPKAAYGGSVTDQTFVSASYQLTVDRFDNRPGDKTLAATNLMRGSLMPSRPRRRSTCSKFSKRHVTPNLC